MTQLSFICRRKCPRAMKAKLPNRSQTPMLARMDKPQDIASPCIRVCAVSARSGFCIGCGRKLGEIGGWQKFSNAEKQSIIDELPERLANSQS